MESALIAKIGDIKEAFAQLQHGLTRELEDLHGIVREQVEERLSGLKGELEDHMQDRLNAMMKHEKDQRNEATRTMQETVQNNIAAAVGSVGATEAKARLHVEESLRAEFSAQVGVGDKLGSFPIDILRTTIVYNIDTVMVVDLDGQPVLRSSLHSQSHVVALVRT
jgi:hypothetical protein